MDNSPSHRLCLLLLIVACLSSRARGADSEAYTDRKLAADNLEFQRKTWLESYNRIGHRDPAWDHEAQEFLEQFCRHTAWANVWSPLVPDDVPGYVQVYRLGRQLLDWRCDDPQVAYAQAIVTLEIGNEFDGVNLLRSSFKKMNDGKHPPENLVRVAHRLRNRDKHPPAGQEEAINAAIEANSVRMAGGFPPTRGERYFRLLIVREDLDHHPEIEEKVCDALAKGADADPWIRHVLEGEHQTHLAWTARGNDIGAVVTPDGWKGFGEHLDKARQHLTDAWKIDPSVPGAADAMITVAMGQDDDRSVRTWFDRAIQAKFDDGWALNGILWASRPRWGGSYEQILALGKQFAATGRYDTAVPYWLFTAIHSIADDRGGRRGRAYIDTQFYKDIQSVFEGYAKALPPGRGKDVLASWHAAVAWRAEEFVDARKVLDELVDRVHRDQFVGVSDDPELAISQVYAYTGQWAKAARDATVEAEKHQDDAALSHFRILANSTPPDDWSSFFYNVYLSRLAFTREIASGNWIDVQPKEALYLWKPERGRWGIDKQGRLVGNGEGTGLRLRLRAEIGPDYEVVATMESQCPPHRPTCCGLFIDHDGTTWSNGLFYSTETQKVTWYANRAQGPVPIPPAESNELHLIMWAHQLTATFNGQKVAIPELVGPVQSPGRNGRLAIAQLFNETDTTLYVTGLKVRLLREEPK